jgi:hypothetical protein
MRKSLIVAALAAAAWGSAASAQTSVVYNGLGVSPFGSVAGNGGAHVLEFIELTSGGFLDTIQFGVTVKSVVPSNIIFLDFYSGADINAADPLAGATLLGSLGFNLGTFPGAGGFLFNPIPLTGDDRIPLTSTSIAVEWSFASQTTTGFAFNPALSPRISNDSASDVGTESDSVFVDANLDGIFAQSELVARPGQFRLVLTNQIPEPSAIGLLAPVGLMLARRRKA